jgi:hypothetical protein
VISCSTRLPPASDALSRRDGEPPVSVTGCTTVAMYLPSATFFSATSLHCFPAYDNCISGAGDVAGQEVDIDVTVVVGEVGRPGDLRDERAYSHA